MKRWIMLVAIVLALFTVMPALAQDDMHMCSGHEGTTVASLRMCVDHAYQHGHITGRGVYVSLVVKLNVAQYAADHGRPRLAILALRAFVREVNAQSGQHIDSEHAMHMIEHAQRVIATLGG